VNPTDLTFWLSWYESLDGALGRAEGSITAYKDPDGRVRHGSDEQVLPVLHEIKELFLRAATVEVFRPRAPTGTQVWPAYWSDTERSEPLIRLVEEPAYIAQGQGFRTDEPEAPAGVRRLIDLLEAQIFCSVVSDRASERCPAWSRIVPELFSDGMDKVVSEALPAFDLLPEALVRETLSQLSLPVEIMSPFLPYVEKDLSLRRLVREGELVAEVSAETNGSDEGETCASQPG
jgi:hypothetical protein